MLKRFPEEAAESLMAKQKERREKGNEGKLKRRGENDWDDRMKGNSRWKKLEEKGKDT